MLRIVFAAPFLFTLRADLATAPLNQQMTSTAMRSSNHALILSRKCKKTGHTLYLFAAPGKKDLTVIKSIPILYLAHYMDKYLLFPGWRPAFEYAGLRWLPQVGERRTFPSAKPCMQLEFQWPGKPPRKNAKKEKRKNWDSVLSGYSVSKSQFCMALEGTVTLLNWIWRGILGEMEELQDHIYIPEYELELAHTRHGIRPQRIILD